MSVPFLALLVLLLAGAFLWLVRPGRGQDHDDAVEDREMLEEAERELEDLDAFASPEDAEEDLPDWGPGAPKT